MSPFPFVIEYEPNQNFPFEFCIRVRWQGRSLFTAYVEADEDVKDAFLEAEGSLRGALVRLVIRGVERALGDSFDTNVGSNEMIPYRFTDLVRDVELAA